jgi:hypothetical protein
MSALWRDFGRHRIPIRKHGACIDGSNLIAVVHNVDLCKSNVKQVKQKSHVCLDAICEEE